MWYEWDNKPDRLFWAFVLVVGAVAAAIILTR